MAYPRLKHDPAVISAAGHELAVDFADFEHLEAAHAMLQT
jgi:hypothetical protein